MLRKLMIFGTLAVAAVLSPTSAGAATIFGATTDGPIGSAPASCVVATNNVPVTCTLWNAFINDGGGVEPAGLHAPADGVVTSWTLATGVAGGVTSMSAAGRVLRADLVSFKGAGTGAAHDLAPTGGGPYTFPERLTVKAGDSFGVDITTNGSAGAAPYIVMSSGAAQAFYFQYAPPVADGASVTPSVGLGSHTIKIGLNATLEPDADKDGYGDETQDGCVQRSDVHDPCPPPNASSLKSAKGGFKVTLDRAAKAQVTIDKVTKGRKVGKKCKAKARRGKSCKIYTKFAQWNDDLVAGSNTISYAYKVGGKKLRRGSYRVTVVMTNAENLKTTRVLNFKVK